MLLFLNTCLLQIQIMLATIRKKRRQVQWVKKLHRSPKILVTSLQIKHRVLQEVRAKTQRRQKEPRRLIKIWLTARSSERCSTRPSRQSAIISYQNSVRSFTNLLKVYKTWQRWAWVRHFLGLVLFFCFPFFCFLLETTACRWTCSRWFSVPFWIALCSSSSVEGIFNNLLSFISFAYFIFSVPHFPPVLKTRGLREVISIFWYCLRTFLKITDTSI